MASTRALGTEYGRDRDRWRVVRPGTDPEYRRGRARGDGAAHSRSHISEGRVAEGLDLADRLLRALESLVHVVPHVFEHRQQHGLELGCEVGTQELNRC